MKKSLILLILAGATLVSANHVKPASANATTAFATCKGDSPCKACKNCKYCKRCSKEAGSCGVCKK